MNMMKKLTMATLAGVALAGAFVATGTQDVKANTITIMSSSAWNEDSVLEQAVPAVRAEQLSDVEQAKKDLDNTLQERGLHYFGQDNIDLADYHGSLMRVFEIDYSTFYVGYFKAGFLKGEQLSEAAFYNKINENLKKHPEVKKIQNEEESEKVFDGLFYNVKK